MPRVLVGERRVVNLGGERPEVLLVAGARRGQRQAHQRAAVEGAVEGDDARAVGVGAGDLHGVLGGLDAGRQQERLVRTAGNQRVEPRRQLHVAVVAGHLEAGVHQGVELAFYGLDHAGMAMPGVEHADAADEVEVLAALGVPHARALGARHEERMRLGHAAGHVLGPQGGGGELGDCSGRAHRDTSCCITVHRRSTWRRSVCSAPTDTRTIQRPSRVAGVR